VVGVPCASWVAWTRATGTVAVDGRGSEGPYASLAFILSSRNFVRWPFVSLGQSLFEKIIAAVMIIDVPLKWCKCVYK
jgi:hypothetical protein